ncbi:MAG: AAA family ATPase [Candidatus Wallbacteria bacterium]|nr:AAA family ATPase [Candidatus Wallbacteria bacterium]
MPNKPGLPRLFGRERELRELVELFPTQKVIMIAGLAGIGKTTLSQVFAASVNKMEKYRDRVLYITCKTGWSETDLFSEILRMAGERGDGKKFRSLSAADAANLLEKKSLALFLDDFHLVENDATRELVRLAESFADGRLVISTRKKIELPPLDLVKIFQIKLAGLPDSDIFLLMDNLLRFHHLPDLDPDQKRKIFEITGGHPFSAKLLISLLISGGYSLESLLEGDFSEKLEQYLLSKFWNGLSKNEQKTAETISLFRIPVKPEKILPPCDAESKKSLEKLLNNFVLEHNQLGRVFLHDLLKEFIDRRLSETDKISLHKKIAGIYFENPQAEIQELKEAYYHYQEAGAPEKSVDVLLRLCNEPSLLGAETENFLHLLDRNLNEGLDNRKQELLRSKIELLVFQRKFDLAEESLGLISGKTARKFLRTKAIFEKGMLHNARTAFEDLLEEVLPDRERYEILLSLASCCNTLGDYAKASEYYLEIQSDEGPTLSPLEKARFFVEYGVFLYFRGDIRQALHFAATAEGIYRDFNVQYLLAHAVYTQARFLTDLQEYEKALECLRRSSIIRLEIKDYHGYAFDCNARGDIFFLQGKIQEAIREKQEGLSYGCRDSMGFIQGVIHNSLGDIYVHTGDWDDAEAHFQTSLEMLPKIDDPWRVTWARQNYAQFLLLRGKISEAAGLLDLVSEFAEISSQPKMLSILYYFKSVISGLQHLTSEKDRCYQKFLLNIARLPLPAQEKLMAELKWFADRISAENGDNLFTLLSREGCRTVKEPETLPFRSQKSKYEFFADFAKKELWIDGKEIAFFKKRVLVPLLFALASSPGTVLKPGVIFQKVWARKYDLEADGSTFRMTITRLRAILGDDERGRFIQLSPETGGYSFNSQCSFCVIYPANQNFPEEK